jgi:hypothetical protein
MGLPTFQLVFEPVKAKCARKDGRWVVYIPKDARLIKHLPPKGGHPTLEPSWFPLTFAFMLHNMN